MRYMFHFSYIKIESLGGVKVKHRTYANKDKLARLGIYLFGVLKFALMKNNKQ